MESVTKTSGMKLFMEFDSEIYKVELTQRSLYEVKKKGVLTLCRKSHPNFVPNVHIINNYNVL